MASGLELKFVGLFVEGHAHGEDVFAGAFFEFVDGVEIAIARGLDYAVVAIEDEGGIVCAVAVADGAREAHFIIGEFVDFECDGVGFDECVGFFFLWRSEAEFAHIEWLAAQLADAIDFIEAIVNHAACLCVGGERAGDYIGAEVEAFGEGVGGFEPIFLEFGEDIF